MNLVERISRVWNSMLSSPEMIIALVVSVVVFTVMYYYMVKFLFDNNSGSMVMLFCFSMIIGAAILSFAGEKINSAIYLIIPAVFIIAILVLYSMEIKRIIWTHKNAKLADLKHGDGVSYDEERIQKCISEIIRALQNMSKNDVGAIVVLSTGNVPSQILDSGVKLDCDISSELIESVFFPKTPLHDGAMIINGTKIVSAGCFLPLSQNVDNIPKDLGTRHRAGIGVTETIDVMSLIVSEETGIISIARAGKITRYADTEALKRVLANYYWQELESARK
ncbi:MAG: DNA integrity scanning protein DisA nucleotide-binding domain protein [Clostridia bacterium]|nr:DNA integrity scanning protein DisA nucleotide-binding domain protein [Clostridia bacterium]